MMLQQQPFTERFGSQLVTNRPAQRIKHPELSLRQILSLKAKIIVLSRFLAISNVLLSFKCTRCAGQCAPLAAFCKEEQASCKMPNDPSLCTRT